MFCCFTSVCMLQYALLYYFCPSANSSETITNIYSFSREVGLPSQILADFACRSFAALGFADKAIEAEQGSAGYLAEHVLSSKGVYFQCACSLWISKGSRIIVNCFTTRRNWSLPTSEKMMSNLSSQDRGQNVLAISRFTFPIVLYGFLNSNTVKNVLFFFRKVNYRLFQCTLSCF